MDQRDLQGKRPWTSEDDDKLRSYVKEHGACDWKIVAHQLGRSRYSCRHRWENYLKPGIVRGNFADEEKSLIQKLHSRLGNKWSEIARHLPGRTDNAIKNFWNKLVKKQAKLSSLHVTPVSAPTTTSDHAYLLAPVPSTAVAGGSSGNSSTCPTVGSPNINGACYSDGFWFNQLLGNHGSTWSDLYAYSFAPFPPPAVADGNGGDSSTGHTVGSPNIDGAYYSNGSWSTQLLGNHDSIWSDPYAYSYAPFPPPAVADGSGGDSSTGHTDIDVADYSDGSWSAQQLGNYGSIWSDHYADRAYSFAPFTSPAVADCSGGNSTIGPTVGHPNVNVAEYSDGYWSSQQLGNHGSIWSAPDGDHSYLLAPLHPPTVAGGSCGATATLVASSSASPTVSQPHIGAEDCSHPFFVYY